MKCPKCRYISFGDGERCRNCGYEFSLLPVEPPVEVVLRRDAALAEDSAGPASDLRLRAQRRRSAAAALTPPGESDAQPAIGFDLPLFNDARDDLPLVSGNTPPRPPLAVRRAAPVTPRPRVEPPVQRPGGLTFPDSPEDDEDEDEAAARLLRDDEAGRDEDADPDHAAGGIAVAPAGARLLGASIDAAITLAIDLAVLYFTLRLCDLPFSEVSALPVIPMAAFLLLLNGGYLTMFTVAGGQTIGKMLAGTRVVPATWATGSRRLSFGVSVIRAAVCFVSLIPAGAGFFMAIVRADGRALHDAAADTVVIKA
jgi:uncharacterized RDD family membrane protein YckC